MQMTGRCRLWRIAIADWDDIPPVTNPMPDPNQSLSRVPHLVLLSILFSLTSFTSNAAQNPPPGTVFRDCPNCPEMVVVPAGTFIMGSPESEEERGDSEGPRAPRNDWDAICRRGVPGDVCGLGRVRERWGVWRTSAGGRGLGPRQPSGDQRKLGGRAGVRAVDVARDRGGVPAAYGGGVGVRGPGGDDDGALLGGERIGSVPVWKWGGRRGPAGIP